MTKSIITVLHFGGEQIRGSEQCLFLTLAGLKEADYEIKVLCNDAGLLEKLKAEHWQAQLFNFPELMYEGSYRKFPFFSYCKALAKLYSALAKTDLVFCNSGLPCQLAVPAAKFRNIPALCHFHHPAPKRYLFFWLVKWVGHLIFPSQYTRSLVKTKCGRSGTVVNNAVDLQNTFKPVEKREQHLRQELGFSDNTVIFSQIGALQKYKNVDLVIKAFYQVHQTYKNTGLVIIGQGPELENLKRLMQELGLQNNVKLLGYVPSVLTYLQQVIDINILASSEEGFGISIIEAAGCKIPTIAAHSTGMVEVVEDSITGLFFPDKNQQALIQSMSCFVRNPYLKKHMGEQARINALEKYNNTLYKQKIAQSVETILTQHALKHS
jgi:glycosyltransferase involved in cell wall biosynthesis